MEIVKRMILDDEYKKELEELGFELDRFFTDETQIVATFYHKVSGSSVKLIINYLSNNISYYPQLYINENHNEIESLLNILENELKYFFRQSKRLFFKNSKDLNNAKKDLLTLARAYNKVFIK